jgi:DNA-binding transcriptional regulator YiaG
MIHAYDKLYLDKAQTALGRMLDYAVYDLGYDPDAFFGLFLVSGCADRFGNGDCSLIVGKSGVELARLIIETAVGKECTVSPRYTVNRSPEYWAGWALAYYQWQTGLSFQDILAVIPLSEILRLYEPYHEMDVRQFCDLLSDQYKKRAPETRLKRTRKLEGLTQSELAEQSGVPLRTLQQYEQRQKDINKAQAEYLIMLAKALHCSMEELIEKV